MPQWTVVEVSKHIGYEHKMVFVFEKPLDRSSFFALDDWATLSYSCQLPINCDVEGNQICSYTPYGKEVYQFEVVTAPSPHPKWPGPRFDHTTKNFGGSYLILTGFYQSAQNVNAKLISGVRTVVGSQTPDQNAFCLTMWTV